MRAYAQTPIHARRLPPSCAIPQIVTKDSRSLAVESCNIKYYRFKLFFNFKEVLWLITIEELAADILKETSDMIDASFADRSEWYRQKLILPFLEDAISACYAQAYQEKSQHNMQLIEQLTKQLSKQFSEQFPESSELKVIDAGSAPRPYGPEGTMRFVDAFQDCFGRDIDHVFIHCALEHPNILPDKDEEAILESSITHRHAGNVQQGMSYAVQVVKTIKTIRPALHQSLANRLPDTLKTLSSYQGLARDIYDMAQDAVEKFNNALPEEKKLTEEERNKLSDAQFESVVKEVYKKRSVLRK